MTKKEIKTVSPKEFMTNALKTKTIILPESRLEFCLKKIKQKDYLEKTSNFFVLNNINPEKIDKEKFIDDIKKDQTKFENSRRQDFEILKLSVVYPNLVYNENDIVDDNDIAIDYLPLQDYAFLSRQILEFNGLDKKPSDNKSTK